MSEFKDSNKALKMMKSKIERDILLKTKEIQRFKEENEKNKKDMKSLEELIGKLEKNNKELSEKIQTDQKRQRLSLSTSPSKKEKVFFDRKVESLQKEVTRLSIENNTLNSYNKEILGDHEELKLIKTNSEMNL